MRTRSPRPGPRDGGRPLCELLAWHGLEGGGWLRCADGALTATLEVRGLRPGAAMAAARVAAGRLGAGWRVLAELQRLAAPGDGSPPRTTVYLTVTRRPAPGPETRRAAVGRRRRRHEVLEADLQLQGESEARLERLRRRAAPRCVLRRLDGRRMARYLHAALTGGRPGAGAGGGAAVDRLLSTGRLHRDDGLRLGDVWIVPVLVTTPRTPAQTGLASLLDGFPGPLRAVFHPLPAARPRAAARAAGDALTVRDLLALPAAAVRPAPRPASRGGAPSAATVLTYDARRDRAADRAAAIAERLRGAGFTARIDDADPAATYLASLPAHGPHAPAHEHGASSIRMQAQRDHDNPAAQP